MQIPHSFWLKKKTLKIVAYTVQRLYFETCYLHSGAAELTFTRKESKIPKDALIPEEENTGHGDIYENKTP